jgi:hypothetical protein
MICKSSEVVSHHWKHFLSSIKQNILTCPIIATTADSEMSVARQWHCKSFKGNQITWSQQQTHTRNNKWTAVGSVLSWSRAKVIWNRRSLDRGNVFSHQVGGISNDSKKLSWEPTDSDPRTTALERTSSNCKRQSRLSSEGAPHVNTSATVWQFLVLGSIRVLEAKTDWPTDRRS